MLQPGIALLTIHNYLESSCCMRCMYKKKVLNQMCNTIMSPSIEHDFYVPTERHLLGGRETQICLQQAQLKSGKKISGSDGAHIVMKCRPVPVAPSPRTVCMYVGSVLLPILQAKIITCRGRMLLSMLSL